MTLYYTDKSTGEMIPVLRGLEKDPTYKVHRLPSPRLHQPTYRTPRRHKSRVNPLNDLLFVLGAFCAVLALLIASAVGPS